MSDAAFILPKPESKRKHVLDLTTSEWVTVIWRVFMAQLTLALAVGIFGGAIGFCMFIVGKLLSGDL